MLSSIITHSFHRISLAFKSLKNNIDAIGTDRQDMVLLFHFDICTIFLPYSSVTLVIYFSLLCHAYDFSCVQPDFCSCYVQAFLRKKLSKCVSNESASKHVHKSSLNETNINQKSNTCCIIVQNKIFSL